jgi:hypothetical protein
MRVVRMLVAVIVFMTAAISAAAQEQLTLEQLIAKHLASIGTPEARAAVKTRVAQGTSKFENVNAGGSIEGKATVVSESDKLRLLMKYRDPAYPGEDMLTDGNKIQVYGRPNRSALGFFVYNQCSALLTEGLFAGSLSTAWPLLDPKLHNAKLTYTGLKTIDGVQLHEVRYEPKKRTDVDIRLYFSKDDFRHVLTIAKLTLSPRLVSNVAPTGDPLTVGPVASSLGSGPDVANATQQEIRYRIEQRFGNFGKFDGLTLPTSDEIRYDLEGQRLAHQRYTNTFNDVVNNVSLDPKNFEMK